MSLKTDFRKTLNLSHIEGGFYALMVAAIENFIFYYAVQTGVSATELGLIATLPLFVGAVGQYILPALVKEKGLGPFVIITMFIQVFGVFGILLHSLFVLPFLWLLISVVLFYLGGMSSSPLWIDWAQNLVPKRNFRRFIARRSSYTWWLILIFFVGLALLNRFFGLSLKNIFLIGFFARVISGFLQIKIQRSRYVKLRESHHQDFSWLIKKTTDMSQALFQFSDLDVVKSHLKKTIIVFLLATAGFKFGVQLAGPFFVDYMIKDLKLDMFWFVILYSIPSLGRALFFKHWSRISDEKFVFQSFRLAMFYLAVIPIIWTLSKSLSFLLFMEVFAGMFWGGFELFSVLFVQNFLGKNSRKLLGLHMALGSLMGLFGALFGAKLFDAGIGYYGIMYASSAGRFFFWFLLSGLIFIYGTYGKINANRLVQLVRRFLRA